MLQSILQSCGKFEGAFRALSKKILCSKLRVLDYKCRYQILGSSQIIMLHNIRAYVLTFIMCTQYVQQQHSMNILGIDFTMNDRPLACNMQRLQCKGGREPGKGREHDISKLNEVCPQYCRPFTVYILHTHNPDTYVYNIYNLWSMVTLGRKLLETFPQYNILLENYYKHSLDTIVLGNRKL